MKMSRAITRISIAATLLFAFAEAPVAPFLSEHTTTREVAASRDPVRAPRGMVASTVRIASEVGRDILQRGGNAIDAAVAVALAEAVTHPAAGNIGGGGFMMIRLKNGKTTAIDYREMGPAAATRNVYLDKDGNLIKGEGSSTVGYRAAGVPGTVRGMELALKKYGSGKMTWAQLVEPARQLAAKGFMVNYTLARSLRGSKDYLGPYPETRRIYLNDGKIYKEGDIFR